MKILDKKFQSKGFNYKQIVREGNFAIYEQSIPGSKTKRYEVVVIKSHNGYEIGGAKIPPSEMYPGSSQWGQLGWTCLTLEDAEKRLKKVKTQELKKQHR